MPKSRIVGWVLPLTLLLGMGVLGALQADRPGGELPWGYDFQAAVRQAERAHRPLLVSFHTSGCDWCAKLDAETFTDAKVVTLSRQYICVRLESDVDGAVCARYGVMEYPTTLLLDPKGRELVRLSGFIPPERFAPALAAGLKAVEQKPADQNLQLDKAQGQR